MYTQIMELEMRLRICILQTPLGKQNYKFHFQLS